MRLLHTLSILGQLCQNIDGTCKREETETSGGEEVFITSSITAKRKVYNFIYIVLYIGVCGLNKANLRTTRHCKPSDKLPLKSKVKT